MRAMVLREQGPPEALQLEDWPDPEPGPGEVLLKIGAAGISYHDIVERNGVFRRGVKLPKVIGNEIAGTVVGLGPGVTRLKTGDRVAARSFNVCGRCRFCRTGLETVCPNKTSIHGAYAEFVALHEEMLVPIPDRVPFPEACQLGSATGVALAALRDAGKVRIAETVLITGASGGVGLPAIEIAKAMGATVIAVTRSEKKKPAIVKYGADQVIVAPELHDFSGEVRDLTDGLGVHAVIDTVGSRVFTPAFKSIRPGGRYVFIGQLFREDIHINPAFIFRIAATITGVTNTRRDQLEDIVKLVADGVVHPPVAAVMKLEEAAKAHAMVEAGEVIGRVVIAP